MTLQEMKDKLNELEKDCINIEAQINYAKLRRLAHEEKEWLVKAKVALRHKRKERSELINLISVEKKKERTEEARAVEYHFVQAAKQVLSKEAFDLIMQGAIMVSEKPQ